MMTRGTEQTSVGAVDAQAERRRLEQAREGAAWRLFGPYLSERQWGTVREDYSPDGSAWSYLSHDAARSRAYRWGEDGLLGFSDDEQRLCFAIALWNGRDPILKERLFGLTNGEGNHGEDVKELYYYLDATPTHSYMRALYRYPKVTFPYRELVEENARRGQEEREYELYDTCAFAEGFFEVQVEYAKASPVDIIVRIAARNVSAESAELHLLPQVWFRNTWSYGLSESVPSIRRGIGDRLLLSHETLGDYQLAFQGGGEVLFTNNETNGERLYGMPQQTPAKDAFHEYVIHGRAEALAMGRGTKAGVHYRVTLAPGDEAVALLRLSRSDGNGPELRDAPRIVSERRRECDAFYQAITGSLGREAARVHRQALAGMLWSKQLYYFDIREWLRGDPGQPRPPEQRRFGRNVEWDHLNNRDVLSMPDKWEYPWYAAWDLAFHCLPLATVDPDFAKDQLVLLTREWYMHANGQLPAYEWAFGDVNPPVHAWAAWRVYEIDKRLSGRADRAFLERVFHKLMLNFTWWVNRKDERGRNVFQGGFLGLDNIGAFDRSAPLPAGCSLDQADGTSWMAMYALNLMRIALELALENRVYEDIATKFFEHFLHIAAAMSEMGDGGLWDERDQFFYDVLRAPDGGVTPLRVRSMVGLIPLFAVEVIDADLLARLPAFAERLRWFLAYRPDLARLVSRWSEPGAGDHHLLSLLRGHRMKRVLARLLDQSEFLSDYGVRSLSRHHAEHPYLFEHGGERATVSYWSGESRSGLFGGNSNWRGPIWFPVNHLIIEALRRYQAYYGDEFRVECPTGSGTYLTLAEIADELARRLTRLFLPDASGVRPLYRDTGLARDPALSDHPLFFEYFDGDDGRGVGASHQTGWTGLIALLLDPRGL